MGASVSSSESYYDYNKCVEIVHKYHRNNPVLSVGSGLGILEDKIIKSGINVTCIDPDPTSFASEIHKIIVKPAFATVDDYLKSHSGQCELILCHTTPNDSIYDIDAINKLDASIIYILYDTSGSAGSGHLHYFIHQIADIPEGAQWYSRVEWPENRAIKCNKKYKFIYHFDMPRKTDEFGFDIQHRIMVLIRE